MRFGEPAFRRAYFQRGFLLEFYGVSCWQVHDTCFNFAAVSESPSTAAPPAASTPVTTGTALTFTINADGTGGEFHFDAGSKSERRKSRPPRPPPPVRRLSSKPASEQQNGNEAVDGSGVSRPRTTSGVYLDGGPPDSISCMQFAVTFTKKNGQ